MKKIIIYIIVLLIALWIPVNRTDISNLEPIQAVWLNHNGESYIIKTDTNDVGVGKTVKQAVNMMKAHCEKIIYLDTAQFLFVDENSMDAIDEISEYLKDKVRICVWNGAGELKKAAEYVKTHRVGVKLKDYFEGIKLPEIPSLEAD